MPDFAVDDAVPRKVGGGGGGIGGGAKRPVGIGGGASGVRGGGGGVRTDTPGESGTPVLLGVPDPIGEPPRPGIADKLLLLAICGGSRLGSEVTGVPAK